MSASRLGYGGYVDDDDPFTVEERANLEWAQADLAVRDAAYVYDEMLGNRRRSEARRQREADQEREQSPRSRFL